MSKVRIVIAGPRGNMGKEAVNMVVHTDDFELVATVDSKHDGMKLSELDGFHQVEVPIYTDMQRCFEENQVDVLIDLTAPAFGRKHMEIAFSNGVRPVVGTTGFTDEDITQLRGLAEEKGLGAIIAPNFAIGAILMMKFSQVAAKYMPDVEIIEQHHDRKLDAPSGTAVKTAQLISEVREQKTQGHPNEKEELQGARGADFEGMRIHSVRLPGRVAHQEVIFGGDGQTLTIRHDSINRTSFMPGVKLAVESVLRIDTLVYGLEHIIE
ncbi:dihydrodipicolinate reductase [Halalkalibacter wakoensis JCM 9140]|uniref:4-hydroxy-tetrahydrodipicolinate reductase n=1 Tax=Halalkalibacter wakoensis JCM 9140 TaxID=1236970 RepID=W4Q018_9BACI|nr:4-hydroxy-tetrahydrodipicolinate reductase [Halalkalibacter wakoensis]GAE25053.1 dihydrodipicolinate reductase [Halalkalibacter wakoensis JCM 9140]